MNATPGDTSIRQWTLATGVEPTLRVGIILDQDACDRVCLRLPDQPYRIERSGAAPAALDPQTPIEVRRDAGLLALRIGDAPAHQAPSLRLTPARPVEGRGLATPATATSAAGAGVLVRDVPAGRGFHWQKRIDQTLTGALELLPGARGIVLVNELGLEDYLAGVITAEMSGACPLEFLKAQCIAARSWLLALTEAKHAGEPFDRCNDDCCQRYQGTGDLSASALLASRATRGRVLLAPAGHVLDANYSKSCGGISESPRTIWGSDKPGLSAVVDAPPGADAQRFFPVTDDNLDEYLAGSWLKTTPVYCSPNVVPPEAIGRYLGRVDEAGDYFRWTLHYTRAALQALLREKLAQARDLVELRAVRVMQRGVSGRASRLALHWLDAAGRQVRTALDSEYRIRQTLHQRFLYSSAVAFHVKRDDAGRIVSVTIRGAGWGHGVGLCQIGALGMALCGSDHESICRHYYPAARLATAYP